MLEDKIFMRTGIELEHLDIVWGLLKLENDPEYKEMIKEFDEQEKLIIKEAKKRDGVPDE